MVKCLASLVLLVFCGPTFAASTELNGLMDTVFATHQFKEVAITTDGAHVAWVEQWPLSDTQYQNHIFVAAANASGPAEQIRVAGSDNDHGLTWSPSGKYLAFLADVHGSPRLHVFDLTTRKIRVVASIAGDLSSPKWSPDGTRIALLVKGPVQSSENKIGNWIKRDTVPETIVLVDPVRGEVKHVGPADLNIYEYDWSPDGKHIAATGATGDGNDNWWIAKLFRIDVEQDTTTPLVTPALQIASPVWAPDGKSIAFLGGLMSDFIAPGGDVFVVSAGGGEAIDITPALAGSASR